MKRLLVVVVLAFALLIPSSALGGAFFYKGPLAGGVNNAVIEFSVKFKDKKPRKVRRFEFANEPPCYYSYGPVQPGWKINRKAKFHGTFHIGSATGTVTGKLKKPANHFKKIVGTLSVQGSCDTGTLDYVAKKGG